MIQVESQTIAASATAPADKDVAWAIVSEEAGEIDPAVEKRVLRKIDAFFMPAMLIGLSYLSSLFGCLVVVLFKMIG